MREVKAWEVDKDYKPFDFEADFNSLSTYVIISNGTIIDEGETFFRHTSLDNPYVLCKDKFTKTDYIYINEDYVKSHYDEVIAKLILFIKNYNRSMLRITSSSLINDAVLEAIANNNYIQFVKLGTEVDPYVLTQERYNLLNSNDNLYEVECYQVEGDFSEYDKNVITWFNKFTLVKGYTYQDLKKGQHFSFLEPLNSNEIEYLKNYISNGVMITFNYADLDNVLDVIKALRGKNITFSLMNTNNIEFYLDKFEFLADKENILVDKIINFKDYLVGEKTLNLIIKDIKDSSMSNYEKYLAVYKLVTHFKEYKLEGDKYHENSKLSYDVYSILTSMFIVCEGYVNLLVELLRRVGIPSVNISVELYKEPEETTLNDFAKYKLSELEIKSGAKSYHARLMIYLIDDKYGINGIYIADPTWDASFLEDNYNHHLMIPYQTGLESRMFYNGEVDLFSVQSSTEFYTKLSKFPTAISKFLDIIKVIDTEFYHYLLEQYDFQYAKYSTEMFIDIYNYIITHSNTSINIDILRRALIEVQKFCFPFMTDAEIKKDVDEIIEKNTERNNFFFPKGLEEEYKGKGR